MGSIPIRLRHFSFMPKLSRTKSTAKWATWRWPIQFGFLIAWLDPFLLRLHSACGPVFHCYSCPLATFACPIGVIANFSAIHAVPFAALGVLALVGAIFGSFVCGWACPFGFLQDLLAKIPTPKFALPGWTGWFRYVTLAAFVLIIPYSFGESHPLFFCSLCPAGALEAALPNVVQQAATGQSIVWPSEIKTIIFSAFVIASLFTWRPWCSALCPLGAIYGLMNHFSLMVLRFHPEQCQGCESCRSVCRDGKDAEFRADSSRCVHCLECSRCSALSVETIFTPIAISPTADRAD